MYSLRRWTKIETMQALLESAMKTQTTDASIGKLFASTQQRQYESLDEEVAALRHELALADARYKGLETTNQLLRRRITNTINDCKLAHARLKLHEHSDVICDFISLYYNGKFMRLIQDAMPDNAPESWTDVCTILNRESASSSGFRQMCLRLTGFTDDEWQALYEFKKERNTRVHPRRSMAIVNKLLKDLPHGHLKTALHKMFRSFNTTSGSSFFDSKSSS